MLESNEVIKDQNMLKINKKKERERTMTKCNK